MGYTALQTAQVGDSFRAFFDAAAEFFAHLEAVSWGALAIALALHGASLTIRTRAWFNALRAAYPKQRFAWREIWAAEIIGLGVNSVIPAHAGAGLRLYLAKRSIPKSTYTAVGSSFLVETVFDVVIGVCVLAYGFSQGIFPSVPDLPSLKAFDLSYLANHPRFGLFFTTALAITLLVVFAMLSVRVREFWAHVRQGLVVLTDRELYFRSVVSFQAIAWLLRCGSIWYLLEAFGIGGSIANVLTVLAVQGIAALVPFTPQGAGVQQVLLLTAFAGVASGAAVAAYSVGQQVAIAAFNVIFGFVALAIVFRTTDWRGLIATGKAEQAADKQARRAARERY